MTTRDQDIRCVQTGGPSGPITQGRFSTKAAVFPEGHLAFVIDGRAVIGTLIPQGRRAEQLRHGHREAIAEAEAYDRAQSAGRDLA